MLISNVNLFPYRAFISDVIEQIKPSDDRCNEIPDLWSSLESEVLKFSYDIFLAASSNSNRYGSLQAKICDLVAALMTYDTAKSDEHIIIKKDTEYGGSWKIRGGVGAFMMLARKWDRIKEQTKNSSISERFAADQRDDGIRDDLNDLRRYLIIVLAYWMSERYVKVNVLISSPFSNTVQHCMVVLPGSLSELKVVSWKDKILDSVRKHCQEIVKNTEDQSHYRFWIKVGGIHDPLIPIEDLVNFSLDNETVIEFRLDPLTYLVHENPFSKGTLLLEVRDPYVIGELSVPINFFRESDKDFLSELRGDQTTVEVQADIHPGAGWISFVDPGFWMAVTIIGSEIVLTSYLTLESMILGKYGTPFVTIKRYDELANTYMMWMTPTPEKPKEVINNVSIFATAADDSDPGYPF